MADIYNFYFLSKPYVRSRSPADRPFSDSSEFTSDKCVQASIYETKYNVSDRVFTVFYECEKLEMKI